MITPRVTRTTGLRVYNVTSVIPTFILYFRVNDAHKCIIRMESLKKTENPIKMSVGSVSRLNRETFLNFIMHFTASYAPYT